MRFIIARSISAHIPVLDAREEAQLLLDTESDRFVETVPGGVLRRAPYEAGVEIPEKKSNKAQRLMAVLVWGDTSVFLTGLMESVLLASCIFVYLHVKVRQHTKRWLLLGLGGGALAVEVMGNLLPLPLGFRTPSHGLSSILASPVHIFQELGFGHMPGHGILMGDIPLPLLVRIFAGCVLGLWWVLLPAVLWRSHIVRAMKRSRNTSAGS